VKRTGIDHPKLRRLARGLQTPRCTAVGVLECLWHFTARHAIRGDVGRWTDEEIAEAIDWPGDAQGLVEALVACRFLDRHPTHRLVVHDWHDHCDQSTRKTLKKHGLEFASTGGPFRNDSGTFQNDSGTIPERSGTIPDRSGQPKPKPKPEPKPEPIVSCSEQNSEPSQFTFPTKGKGGKKWTLPQAKLDEYRKAYPDLDLESEMRKARQWTIDNPRRQKTPGGMLSFLTAWLNRAQNNGQRNGNGQTTKHYLEESKR